MIRPRFDRLEGRATPAGFVVTTTSDTGPGSLRDAVAAADALPGADTITFDATLGQTILVNLTGGAIAVRDAVTILGPAGRVTLLSDGTDRVMVVDKLAATGTAVWLENIVLTGGQSADNGGNLFVEDEAVTLVNCVISNGEADIGGGVYTAQASAALTLIDCHVTGNKSVLAFGGGIAVFGSLSLDRTTVSANTAVNFGGGLGLGGTTHAIRNSTVSGNTAGGSGGGIAVVNFGGPLTLTNSTVTANSGTTGNGGGLARLNGTSAIALESTVLSGNSSSGKTDVFSNVSISAKSSAVGPVAGAAVTDLGGNLPAGTDVKLAPLAENGGPTPTHRPLTGSPLLDAGLNPLALTVDQRGQARVVGVPDIGAVELQPPPRVSGVVVNGGSPQRSRVSALTVTFDHAVTVGAAFELTRQGDGAKVDVTVAKLTAAAAELTFGGPLTQAGSLADGRYTLRVIAAAVSGDQPLDGNGDGTAGDDYVLVGTPANGLFRLFGDNDGNGAVNFNDFLAFRSTFGLKSADASFNSAFDADGSGAVDFTDFLQFRTRFGQSI